MDANGLEPVERVPASRKLGRSDASAILSDSSRVVIAKGRSLESFDLVGGGSEEVLDRMLGTTGNLRAPLIRSGRLALVGFHEEAWTRELL